MPEPDLLRRVTTRIVATEQAEDAELLLTADATIDVLRLLCEAAPGPEASVDLDLLRISCWAFWYRAHGGERNPDAEMDGLLAVALRNLLRPHLPDPAALPALPEGVDEPEIDQFTRLSGIACVVAAAGSRLAAALRTPSTARSDEPAVPSGPAESLAALDRGIAWLSGVRPAIPPEHEGFGDVLIALAGAFTQRFELDLDPDSLARAAEAALDACLCVSPQHPRQGIHLPQMLYIVGEAAYLLGNPSLPALEDVAHLGITPVPQTTARIDALRALFDGDLGEIAGQIDGAIGVSLYLEGIGANSAPTLACAVLRLRAALAALPAQHPDRGGLSGMLHDADRRLSLARQGASGDDGSGEAAQAQSAADLRIAIEATTIRFIASFMQAESGTPEEAGPLLGRVLDLGDRLAVSCGLPGLPPDVRAAIAFIDAMALQATSTPETAGERIARYRKAVDELPEECGWRHAYAVILAVTAHTLANAVREQDPDMAARFDAEAQAATKAAAVTAPADFEPLSRLRANHRYTAFFGAWGALPAPPWSAQSERVLEMLDCQPLRMLAGLVRDAAMSALQELGGDISAISALESLASDDPATTDEPRLAQDLRNLRTALERIEFPEEERAELRRAGAQLLSSEVVTADISTLPFDLIPQVIEMLRPAQEGDQPSELVHGALSQLLMLMGLLSADPALVLESAAMRDEAEQTVDPAAPRSAAAALRSGYIEFFNSLLAYILQHDIEQLEHARRSADRLLELSEHADAGAGVSAAEIRSHARSLRDMVDLIGPGGGPSPDTTDEMIERCRLSYRDAPAGQHKAFAGQALIRALLQRAAILRTTDPGRAGELTDEAEAVLGETADELPQGLTPALRAFIHLLRRGPAGLDELSTAVGGPAQTEPEGKPGFRIPFGFGEGGLIDPGKDRGETFLAGLRNTAAPAWMRAHSGIGAAAHAANLDPPRLDLALAYCAETVSLLERATDRGGPARAAEHALHSFDGDVRGIVALIVVRVLLRENFTRLARIQQVAAELVAKGEPERVGELTSQASNLIRVARGAEVDAAVALHERGRGLLLARRLESRADLDALAQAHPELARRFEQLTARLADGSTDDDNDGSGNRSARDRLAALRTSQDFDKLLEEIRAQQDFEDFIGALSPRQLQELAADGPIVALNHIKGLPCLAFIVTTSEITAINLELEPGEVTEAAERLRRSVEMIYARGGERPSPSGLKAARDAIRDTLSWTWHRAVRPVLDFLGYAEPVPPDGSWPRIWWVPTGSFASLPLQAAQCAVTHCPHRPGEGCGGVLDTVVSSFVPGFQTLAYARSRAARHPSVAVDRALIVMESDDALPGAEQAARIAADALGTRTVLAGAAATREAVLIALRDSPWVQFGCHAHGSPDQPAGSWIRLPDGERLSVPDICRIRPDEARLAVLTACGTARTADRLADEAVHVTSAFLLAGYPEAVGTLWEVDSTRLPAFLTAFYSHALAQATPPAHALHHAVRELRDRIPDQPHVWAAYIHAGS